jgi:hypothetical protein
MSSASTDTTAWIGDSGKQVIKKVLTYGFVLNQSEQFLELVNEQQQVGIRVAGKDALGGAHQAAPVFYQLIEKGGNGIDGHAQQGGLQFFQGVGAGQHLGDEPAGGIGQSAPAQRRDETGLDDTGFAAARRPDNCQESSSITAVGQTRQQPLSQGGAPEEVASIALLEGA